MTKRASREKPRKLFDNLEEIYTQLGYTSNFPVNHNNAIKAAKGWLVKTASKSQQDKTNIIK
jgi:hypothetical protein